MQYVEFKAGKRGDVVAPLWDAIGVPGKVWRARPPREGEEWVVTEAGRSASGKVVFLRPLLGPEEIDKIVRIAAEALYGTPPSPEQMEECRNLFAACVNRGSFSTLAELSAAWEKEIRAEREAREARERARAKAEMRWRALSAALRRYRAAGYVVTYRGVYDPAEWAAYKAAQSAFKEALDREVARVYATLPPASEAGDRKFQFHLELPGGTATVKYSVGGHYYDVSALREGEDDDGGDGPSWFAAVYEDGPTPPEPLIAFGDGFEEEWEYLDLD